MERGTAARSSIRPRQTRVTWLCAALTCVCVAYAHAGPADRSTVPSPHNERELLAPSSDTTAKLQTPKVPHQASGVATITNDERFRVNTISLIGNTLLTRAELTEIADRYTDRDLGFGDLLALRDELTLAYVNKGYLSSGIIIDHLKDDHLVLRAVEGRLKEIRVVPGSTHNPDYIRGYLQGFGDLSPVNIFDIESRLQMLQTSPQIRRIEARLVPGSERGESILWVDNEDNSQWHTLVEANNHIAPALGEGQLLATVAYGNPRGRGDNLQVGLRRAEGLTQFSASYETPLNHRDTKLTLFAFGANSEVVAEPYDSLGIEANSRTYGVRISHPLSRTLSQQLTIFLTGEWRETDTDLLGTGFSFVEGPDNGEVRAAVVRAGWEFNRRSTDSALAGRVQVSTGLDVFDATNGASVTGATVPKAKFTTVLGQLQWARRFAQNNQLITRVDLQWASRPLFGLEQMPIGGRWSVRGYRENTLIRDSAVVTSVEWRSTVRSPNPGERWQNGLTVIAFADWAHSWNDGRAEVGPTNIYGAGLGFVWEATRNSQVELMWAHAFTDIDYPGSDPLQDDGIHMRLRWWTE